MPNHITTDVEITGTKEQIDKLVEKTKLIRDNDTHENQFDFNGIVETPKDIYQGNLGQAELEKYGNKNWCDWNTANWGTKWNSYEVRYITGNDTTLVISIQTAWDTPRQIWEALEEQGYTVKGVMYGEMDGYDFIGDGSAVFDAWQDVNVDYMGDAGRT